MTEGSKLGPAFSEGAILAGKYRIERVLGEGGMGVVVAARHLELDEKVAIKFLLTQMLTDDSAVERFRREAKAAVRIKNEHVVRVFDVGRLDDGAPYMVMEFLEGSDLSQWLQQYGPLPVAQAVDFVLQACVALADAHALGIVHRDLKPANLFCVRRSDGQPSIKVLDFGISKLMQPPGADMSFTRTSAMMGSPFYMSPEQFRSTKNVDTRTDLWALGAILFELITGGPPFDAATVPELAIKISTEPPPSATQLRPDVPVALASVITACLERDPERRPQNVAELALALGPFATPAGRALVERVVGVVGKRDMAPPSSFSQSDRGSVNASGTATALHVTTSGAPRRNGMARTLGVLGACGLVATGALVWWRTTSAPSARTASASAEVYSPVAAPPAAPSLAPPSPVVSVAPAAPAASESSAPVVPQEAAAVSTRERKKHVPAAKQAAPAARTTAPHPGTRDNCDPPFYFDVHGNRVFKQECL